MEDSSYKNAYEGPKEDKKWGRIMWCENTAYRYCVKSSCQYELHSSSTLLVFVADVFISSLSLQSASVTDTLRAAILIGRRGASRASAAEACATVSTTLKDASVRNVKPASTETLSDRRAPPTPANVRFTNTEYILVNCGDGLLLASSGQFKGARLLKAHLKS